MIVLGEYTIDKVGEDDAVDIHKLMFDNAERFQRFFPETLEHNLSIASAKLFAAKKANEFNTNEEFLFCIEEGKTNRIVGLVYIKELDWEKKQGEFAYCIGSGYEGKSIMTEAIRKLSNYAFAKLKLDILQIIVHKDNFGSVKVAKNCNFIWQKTLQNEYTPPNESPLDMELYELKNEG